MAELEMSLDINFALIENAILYNGKGQVRVDIYTKALLLRILGSH